MNFKDIYTNIFSTVNNYCHKDINIKEVKHSWLVELDKKNSFKSVVDIGSGTGAMLSYFKNKNIDILATDLDNFLVHKEIPFQEINLMEDLVLDKVYDLLVCCDVIEHLPLPYSVGILDKIKPFGSKFLIAIANHSDIINNIELHLTCENKDFWDKEILKRFNIINTGSFYKNKLFMYELEPQ